MKTKQIKAITLCCRRVCGGWLWADQAVVRLLCCWIFFFSQVGWTIQNCQFLVRVCFNQSIKLWEKALKNNCRKGWLWICLKIKMKYNKNKFHRVCWLKSWQKINAPFQNDVPDPKELSPEQKNLMIFDDLLLQKQNKCEAYYVRGKHSNCDCLYLSQNYFKLPRQTIRENANFFCLFPQDQKNIGHIFSNHVSQDMTNEQFKKLCKHAWSKPHNFVVIDLTLPKNYGKYRSGFDNFYIIE